MRPSFSHGFDDQTNRVIQADQAAVEPELPFSFGTEPMLAWRAWGVGTFYLRSGLEWRLYPLGWRSGPWPPRQRHEATCTDSSGVPRLHEAPWPDCTCGCWAVPSREASEARTTGHRCFGRVVLWGRVLEFEEVEPAFRAQYAYPVELFVRRKEHLVLGRIYGVPVSLVEPTKKQPRTTSEP